MREIKFRAWIHDENNISEGWMSYKAYPMLENEIYIDGDVCDIDECVELMQYTGLKDKNGKEIYEGDICDCYGLGDRCKIEYLYSSFYVQSEIGGTILSTVRSVEVVGNIYESPELAK